MYLQDRRRRGVVPSRRAPLVGVPLESKAPGSTRDEAQGGWLARPHVSLETLRVQVGDPGPRRGQAELDRVALSHPQGARVSRGWSVQGEVEGTLGRRGLDEQEPKAQYRAAAHDTAQHRALRRRGDCGGYFFTS